MIVRPTPAKVVVLTNRLDQLIGLLPRQLTPILRQLQADIRIALLGIPERPHRHAFNGPGDTWHTTGIFTAHGHVWVGVEWPWLANSVLTERLCKYALRLGIGHKLAGCPENQLWICLSD